MKRIGIDARLYSQTGVGTYLNNLLFYLDKSDLKNKKIYVYLLKKDFDLVHFKNKSIIKKIADYKWHSFSEQIGFLLTLLKDNLDLVHFTYFTFPILYPKKFILTVHDLTPILFKTGKASTKNKFVYYFKHFIFKIFFALSIKRASIIITPTKTVKNQLNDYFKNKFNKKVVVTYEGVSFHIFNSIKKIRNYSKFDFKKFFLYVGNFYPHKNVENLLYAFLKIKGNYQLVLIGPEDFFTQRIERLIKKLSDPRIYLIKNLTQGQIAWFYKNCLALIHPSLSEGFGLTLVEAAYFNKPILASDIPVFKELWGKNYLSFNPQDIDDIAKKIYLFLKNKPKFDYSKLLIRYSFKELTNKTLKIYEKTLQ
ncbi:MAG: glycosyltransferase family 4 protein [Microgenomates group bacterium]